MKKLVIIILLFTTTFCFGQLDPRPPLGVEVGKKKGPQYSKTSPIKVMNLDSVTFLLSGHPRFIVNGKHYDQARLTRVNPESVKEVTIDKKRGEHSFQGKQYYGEVHITLKHEPEFISLTDLEKKYIPKNDYDMLSTIFFEDGILLKGNYDKIMVDQKNILKIEFERLHIRYSKRQREFLNGVVVKIFSRSEENIKKANEIMIRGNEMIDKI